LIVFDALVVG